MKIEQNLYDDIWHKMKHQTNYRESRKVWLNVEMKVNDVLLGFIRNLCGKTNESY